METKRKKKKQLKQRPEIRSSVVRPFEHFRWLSRIAGIEKNAIAQFESGGTRMSVSRIREIIEMWQQKKHLTSDRRHSSTKRTANYRVQCAQLTTDRNKSKSHSNDIMSVLRSCGKNGENTFLFQLDEVRALTCAKQGAREQINFQRNRCGSQWTSERTV